MANNNINLDAFLEENDNFNFDAPSPLETTKETISEIATATKPKQSNEIVSEPTQSPAQETEQPTLTDDTDPFEAAFKKCEEKNDQKIISALTEKNPIFSYAKAEEEIIDKDITFDQLREKFETDFPELSERKKVSFTVIYGKTTKTVTNPQTEKIFEMKTEIEKSKKFLDELKKAKSDADKNPVCYVKPKVTAQSKGEAAALPKPERRTMPSYKGFFMNMDEAINSKKAIALVPSRNGKVYEIRKNEIGTFVSPAGGNKNPSTSGVVEFDDIRTFFDFNLPKIPFFILHQIINFFKAINGKFKTEVLVHILFDTEKQEYSVTVPKQKVSRVSVSSDLEEYPEHIIHVMDIHSHNVMAARFSGIDDSDERATRLYGVIGNIERFFPDMSFRASNGGKFIRVNAPQLFDFDATYPEEWFDTLNDSFASAICESEKELQHGERGVFL